MKRRDFLTAGSAGLAVLTTAATASAQNRERLSARLRQTPATLTIPKQFIEVRKYAVKDAEKRAKLVEVLDQALIPALNRQGIKPVGVLVPIPSATKYANNVFVVFPHKTAESFVNVAAKLLADTAYMKDAAPIFETTSKDPVYTDCETYFLQGFPTMPTIEVPDLGPNRVFEWRFYRSFNIERNAAKIRMFDVGGELPLFREVGMNPIFFGDVIAGNWLPALMYMIGFSSMEAHAEAWKAFGAHPKWQAMRGLPEYADTATEIVNAIMTPSPGSQI